MPPAPSSRRMRYRAPNGAPADSGPLGRPPPARPFVCRAPVSRVTVSESDAQLNAAENGVRQVRHAVAGLGVSVPQVEQSMGACGLIERHYAPKRRRVIESAEPPWPRVLP